MTSLAIIPVSRRSRGFAAVHVILFLITALGAAQIVHSQPQRTDSGGEGAAERLIQEILALEREIADRLERLSPEERLLAEAQLEAQRQRRRELAAQASAAAAAAVDAKETPRVRPATARTVGESQNPSVSPSGEESSNAAATASALADEEKPETSSGSSATAAAPEIPSPPRSTDRTVTCNLLQPFDSNDDQVFSGADRHWRHFYLWNDRNDNDSAERDELTSLFDAGVREVRLDLRRFDAIGDQSGDIVRGSYLEFRSPRARKRRYETRGRLVLDLDDIARSDGPSLFDADGARLQGVQALMPGLLLTAEESSRQLRLVCP